MASLTGTQWQAATATYDRRWPGPENPSHWATATNDVMTVIIGSESSLTGSEIKIYENQKTESNSNITGLNRAAVRAPARACGLPLATRIPAISSRRLCQRITSRVPASAPR